MFTAEPVCSWAAYLFATRLRDRGCSAHPVFPAPSDFEGKVDCKTSGASRREIGKVRFGDEKRAPNKLVMPGLDPGIHVLLPLVEPARTWMAGQARP